MERQIRDMRRKNWFSVDNKIIDYYAKEIGPYGVLVYIALTRYAHVETQMCFPSYKTIADKLGISRRMVIYAIKKLVAAGLIKVERRRSGSNDSYSNIYTLFDVSEQKGGVVNNMHHLVNNMHQGSESHAPKQYSDNNTYLKMHSNFSKNQLGEEKKPSLETSNQNGETNDVLEQVSRNLVRLSPTGGLDHISVLAEKAMRLLGGLPRQTEPGEETICKRCDGTRAITRKIRGMVYECACSCAANY